MKSRLAPKHKVKESYNQGMKSGAYASHGAQAPKSVKRKSQNVPSTTASTWAGRKTHGRDPSTVKNAS